MTIVRDMIACHTALHLLPNAIGKRRRITSLLSALTFKYRLLREGEHSLADEFLPDAPFAVL